MNIGFIGAGKVGQSFAIFLHGQEQKISGFYSRHIEKSQEISEIIGCKLFTNLYELVDASDMIAITVNDDQISNVADEIYSLDMDLSHKYFFHMSGVYSSDLLKKLSSHVFSLHPLKAFPKVEGSRKHFAEIYFSIEHADAFISKWLSDLALNVFNIKADQKTRYHAAAVILSNYLVAIVDYGLKQMEAIGVDEELARQAMWPLIQDTLANVEKLGTHKALTGPIARGDVETVKRHLESFDNGNDLLYRALGSYTLTLATLSEDMKVTLGQLFKEVNHE